MSTASPLEPLVRPGHGRGLADVPRHRYLLRLLVNKEIQVRYRGSILGLVWSYIKPGVQFLVFYLALGLFLGLNKNMENYPVYLFSGIVLINFFGEAFGNGARAMVANGALIKKIYLPRELFSVSTVWVALIHFLPQLLVLLLACLLVGWHPSLLQLAVIVVAMLIMVLLSAGLGLVFGVANVFFRDSENIVDLLTMVATWLSPVLYVWTMVAQELPGWAFPLYMANPITVAVELFHYGFWQPTTSGTAPIPPHLLSLWTPVALGISLVVLVLGDLMFRRLEGRFAQEL
ncbi:transport permease protein [Tersicoccus solisilvae]|uniref:Transport permease protein n=1 Tax=Tersicoccus solisilvae TaxID=1882339 RepID=A0ABQ1NY25_9MICC|nr:ABC transporter permease [Tersicoccus solisilvae]GGC87435.1 transport permease protein [Tersicoccus solisilvae]